jgi:hypothetical protein
MSLKFYLKLHVELTFGEIFFQFVIHFTPQEVIPIPKTFVVAYWR